VLPVPLLPLPSSLFCVPGFIIKKTVDPGIQKVPLNYYFPEIPLDQVPNPNCISPQFLGVSGTPFRAIGVFLSTTLAKKVENWFGGCWEFVVFVAVLVVKIVACKAKDGFGAVTGSLALVVGVGG